MVTKVLYDTYDREVQRYGGVNGIDLCERIFGVDSEAVLELIASTLGDEGAVARWQLTLVGMDSFLRDAGFEPEQRYFFADRVAGSYGREFNLEGQARHPIQDKFRNERRALFALLDRTKDATSPLEPGLATLRRRSERMVPILSELRQRGERGELTVPFPDIVGSLIHMHANRMLPTAAKAQEAVLYRFLENLYDSQLARSGKKKRDRRDGTVAN
jgi:thiopeptide-type bacteriocin biosynthesis protein